MVVVGIAVMGVGEVDAILMVGDRVAGLGIGRVGIRHRAALQGI